MKFIWSRKKRRPPRDTHRWSIGYQTSNDPISWDPSTAHVYRTSDVDDRMKSLADPFLIRIDSTIYLFFEIEWNAGTPASIGVSRYEASSEQWQFLGVVLEENFHVSFPSVFSHDDAVYMIPETKQSKTVRLYRAENFPTQWKLEKTLLENKKLVDPCVFQWEDTWYLFASRKRKLSLFWSDSLTSKWRLHPESPIKLSNYTRCAGRIHNFNGTLLRLAQQQDKVYGAAVHVFRILELSRKHYREIPQVEHSILEGTGETWAKVGIHHLDFLKVGNNEYLGVFDGYGNYNR